MRDAPHNQYGLTPSKAEHAGGQTVTISQLLHQSIKQGQPESTSQEAARRVLPVLRRCLIWSAIVIVASWIISSHVFAEEITPAPVVADVADETTATVVLRHARPERISSQIDPDQIPPNSNSGSTQPAFSWNDSDYWAQGLNFGLEARF